MDRVKRILRKIDNLYFFGFPNRTCLTECPEAIFKRITHLHGTVQSYRFESNQKFFGLKLLTFYTRERFPVHGFFYFFIFFSLSVPTHLADVIIIIIFITSTLTTTYTRNKILIIKCVSFKPKPLVVVFFRSSQG